MLAMAYDGNIFLLPKDGAEAAVVTTNGMLKRDGKLVMGAGIAKYCRDTFPGIDAILGWHVKQSGNVPAWTAAWEDFHREAAGLDPFVNVISCPTKHDWRNPSDLNLIVDSCRRLPAIADEIGLDRIYLPALGCGLGGLNWKNAVMPAIAGILDDRFVAAIPKAML